MAKEILLAGRILDADEAHALRLLNEVVEADDLEAAGHRLADRIARQGRSPYASPRPSSTRPARRTR